MTELKYNHPILKTRRQELRRNQTKVEGLLWDHLRDRQVRKLKVYRQYSVGSYILDFFLPAVRVAIELDGDHHSTREIKEYDGERELFLESEDIRVIRFKNDEVLNDVRKVVERIKQFITLREGYRGAPSLSVREGGGG